MPTELRILSVVGARPQFIKSAALQRAVAGPFAGRIHNATLHTGQHYDPGMSEVFFEELGLDRPQVQIPAPDQALAGKLGRMLRGVEGTIHAHRPDLVVVYGDTTSTLAGVLGATRCGVPVAHVEAGLRSYDGRMPEEENRVLADHASTWLFCPTETGLRNLEQEGIVHDETSKRTRLNPAVLNVGDVMLDNALHFLPQVQQRRVLDDLELRGKEHILGTVHRAGTVDDPSRLAGIMEAFAELARSTGWTVVVPLHPRTANMLGATAAERWSGLRIVPPVGYLDMLALVHGARLVLTDSGGLQKEACFLGKRCAILREVTEWPELLGAGGACLVGTDKDRIIATVSTMLQESGEPIHALFGDGHAAEHICAELLRTT